MHIIVDTVSNATRIANVDLNCKGYFEFRIELSDTALQGTERMVTMDMRFYGASCRYFQAIVLSKNAL